MLKFDRQGLIPVVIQDDSSGEVLMVAFMNQEALQLTRDTGYTHLFSRSRNALWRKGEQSGHAQEVRALFVNCEENSLLLRVVQQGGAACHEGYRSCYYRRLLPDDTYETIAERVFDPASVYPTASTSIAQIEASVDEENASYQPVKYVHEQVMDELRQDLSQLYGVYIYLRDHDMSEESNTSRLLQDHSPGYLKSRLADELQELAEVQSGEHVHSGRQFDTILEGSQVGYWLFLLASTFNIPYGDFEPQVALLRGFSGQYSESKVIEMRQECLNLLAADQSASVARALQVGFSLIGWACAEAGVSPYAPAQYDLEQMRRKGLVR